VRAAPADATGHSALREQLPARVTPRYSYCKIHLRPELSATFGHDSHSSTDRSNHVGRGKAALHWWAWNGKVIPELPATLPSAAVFHRCEHNLAIFEFPRRCPDESLKQQPRTALDVMRFYPTRRPYRSLPILSGWGKTRQNRCRFAQAACCYVLESSLHVYRQSHL
jgi:hypothetical protein